MPTTPSEPQAGAVRTFLAVDLPEPVRSRLRLVQAPLARHDRILKLVDAGLAHITVRFVGGVPPSRLAALESAAAVAAANVGRFALTLNCVGMFPERQGRPRVIWAGLERDAGYERLAALFRSLEDGLVGQGFERESRAYAPHLTLARVRDDRPRQEYDGLREAVEGVKRQFGSPVTFPVDELIVFRSDLGRTGPTYTPLARFPLRLD